MKEEDWANQDVETETWLSLNLGSCSTWKDIRNIFHREAYLLDKYVTLE